MASSIVQLIGELAIYFALVLAAVAIHEAGHVIAGLSCGLRILAVRIGPLRLNVHTGRTVNFEFGHLTGGIVRAQFKRLPGKGAGWRVALFLLGGPLANLVFAVSTALWWDSMAGGILALLAIVSALIGMINLFPFRTRLDLSDGAKLIGMLFSKSRREKIIADFTILPQIDEVNRLCRSKQFDDAYREMNALIALLHSNSASFASSEFARSLIRVKEQIRAHLDHQVPAPSESPVNVPETA
jgi:hypothetical protein